MGFTCCSEPTRQTKESLTETEVQEICCSCSSTAHAAVAGVEGYGACSKGTAAFAARVAVCCCFCCCCPVAAAAAVLVAAFRGCCGWRCCRGYTSRSNSSCSCNSSCGISSSKGLWVVGFASSSFFLLPLGLERFVVQHLCRPPAACLFCTSLTLLLLRLFNYNKAVRF